MRELHRSLCIEQRRDRVGSGHDRLHAVRSGTGSAYSITGDPFSLGTGITATGTDSLTVDRIAPDITVADDQSWTVDDLGVDVEGDITGAPNTTLGVDISGGSLELDGSNEMGAFTATGGSSERGVVYLGPPIEPSSAEPDLNGGDGNPVVLDDVDLIGAGQVGALSTMAAEVAPGDGSTQPGILTTSSAVLDQRSIFEPTIGSDGATPGTDFGQLASTGPVTLNGVQLFPVISNPEDACFSPKVGDSWPLITASSISGQISDGSGNLVPDDGTFSVGCDDANGEIPPVDLRITYTATSVTATVVNPVTVAASVTPASVEYGATVTYAATVRAPSSPAPSGSVTFTDRLGAALCTAALSPASTSSSTGSCTSDAAPNGSDQPITPTYQPDGAAPYGLTSGPSVPLTVTPIPTTTTLTATPTSVEAGQATELTATVTVSDGSAPPGSVGFTGPNTPYFVPGCGSVALSASAPYTATCDVTLGSTGSDNFSALYIPAGTSNDGSSVANTTVTVTASSGTAPAPSGGEPAPTGTSPAPSGGASGSTGTTAPATGYRLAASDGGVFSYGLPFFGSAGRGPLAQPVVGMADDTGGGYDLVAADGGVFTFGPGAEFHGSTGGMHLNRPIVGMAVDPVTGGYWLVASDGGVFAFDAPYFGSTGGEKLDQPIVGITAAPSGDGYDLVAADGGVFTFGPGAEFHGSTGGMHLNRPIVGMAVDPVTGGYWLVASDGGVFAFDAPYEGSAGDLSLAQPIVGMQADPTTGGYWLVAADGGIFAYGAPFEGSPGGTRLQAPVVGMG